MKKTLCQITAQRHENYGYHDGTEHWKPKGGHVFHLKVDSDLFLYGENICIEAIKDMLKEESNTLERFEYVSHELIFHEPTELNEQVFEYKFHQLIEEKHETNQKSKLL